MFKSSFQKIRLIESKPTYRNVLKMREHSIAQVSDLSYSTYTPV
uniref:Uncharacterized protein n=1 Tax=Anguilla anguilla TaxID=7936 RepID=A0A0E9Q6C4_ANGAN